MTKRSDGESTLAYTSSLLFKFSVSHFPYLVFVRLRKTLLHLHALAASSSPLPVDGPAMSFRGCEQTMKVLYLGCIHTVEQGSEQRASEHTRSALAYRHATPDWRSHDDIAKSFPQKVGASKCRTAYKGEVETEGGEGAQVCLQPHRKYTPCRARLGTLQAPLPRRRALQEGRSTTDTIFPGGQDLPLMC